jgi:hypothetical protein
MMHPRLIKSFALSAATTALLLASGCADAPITASQVEQDGRLRAQQDPSVALFSVQQRPAVREAQPIAVAAVLASEAEGALEDRTQFTVKDEVIHLHLRVDGLNEAWPVSFVWTHDGVPQELAGQIEPTETLQMANAHVLERGDAGHWKVEVFALRPEGPALLVEREFDVARR